MEKKVKEKKVREKKSVEQKISEELQDTKEVLENFKNITSQELKYAKESEKLFLEENEAFFYVTIVFQNNACAAEFCDNFQDLIGLRTDEQMFIDGHELAKKWGKPITTSYVKKTINLDKRRDENMISQVGIYGE